MRHPAPSAAACATLACLLAACGQTGPLYLPDEGVTTPVEIRPAPAAQEPAPAPAAAGPETAAPAPAAPATQDPQKDGGKTAPGTGS